MREEKNKMGMIPIKIERREPIMRWIPCSECLPDEDNVDVLVTNDAGGMKNIEIDSMGSYEDGSGRFWWNSQNPVAWMPLPECYEEKK